MRPLFPMARPTIASMSRKPKKGYFVRGQFVAEGSELDLELKRELKGTDAASKTDLKRESTELQELGEALLALRADLFDTPGPRRKAARRDRRSQAHHQFRRAAPPDAVRRQADARRSMPRRSQRARALDEQNRGSAPGNALRCTRPNAGATELIADDDALGGWIETHPRHRRAAAARAGAPGAQGHQGRPARRGAAPRPRPTASCSRSCVRSWRARHDDQRPRPRNNRARRTHEHHDRPVRIGIVSVSDRASSGVYEDKGMPALKEWLQRALRNPIAVRDAPDPRRAGAHQRHADRAGRRRRAATWCSPPAAPARRCAT